MKHRLFLLGGAALSLLFSCSRAEFEPMDPASGNEKTGRTVLEATAAGDLTPDSKTSFGEKTGNAYPILWSAGDCISVNGVASAELASGGATTASFSFDGMLDAPFQGVYPSSAVNAYFNGEYSVSVPSGQTYTPGQFDPAAGLMLASGSSNLTFKHVMAYLKVTVAGSGSEKIQFISVAARGDENLSGTFAPVFGETPSLTGGADGNDVTLDCGTEGVALGTEFIIPIPARTLASGLCVTVRTTDKKYCIMESTPEFAPEAGKIYKTSFTFVEKGRSVGIWTEDDLKAFLAAADGGKTCSTYTASVPYSESTTSGDFSAWVADDGEVHIWSDITLSEKVDWSSTDSKRYNVVTYFDGILNGEGHMLNITGTWTTPMFLHHYGTIKNLKVNGNMVANHANGLGGGFVDYCESGAVVKNVENYASVTYNSSTTWDKIKVGGIVSLICGGTVEYCTNYGTITYAGQIGSGAQLGGVVGAMNPGTMRYCTNYGNVVTSVVKKSDGSRLCSTGGVTAYVYGTSSTFEHCYNRADCLDGGTAKWVGGVAAEVRVNSYNLHNYGRVMVADDNDGIDQMGGVATFVGSGYTLTDCTNNAPVHVGGSAQAGGIVCVAYGNLTRCVNNADVTCADGNVNARVSGVARQVNNTSTLTDCSNTADHVVNTTFYGGVTATNSGTMTGCSNSGAISFARESGHAAGVLYNNSGTMSDCNNSGAITCDKVNCSMAGVAMYNQSSMTNCDNTAAISVTGDGSFAAGVCHNFTGGILDGCDNSGNITVSVEPASAGVVQFMGGVVGIVSKINIAGSTGTQIFPTEADGRYGPAQVSASNVLDAILTIQNCTNTGNLKMTCKPASSEVYLRNVAIGGIVGWNWAQASDDYYLKILNCTNGSPSVQLQGRLEYEQSGSSPYIGPALGGILGWSGPYNTSNTYGLLSYTPGYAVSKSDLGYKVWIEGCNSYGRIANMASYSSSPGGATQRSLRPCGGIAGALYGNSTTQAVVKGCTSACYILTGQTKTSASTTAVNQQSRTNAMGGVAGAAAFVDVEGCTVLSSNTDTYGIGSETRYAYAAGGVFGVILEKFSVKNCTLHMRMGYCNNKDYDKWGLVAGSVVVSTRGQGYTTLMGSEITNNKILPGRVTVGGNKSENVQDINSSNFNTYLISASDAADNATHNWLTLSGNTWE